MFAEWKGFIASRQNQVLSEAELDFRHLRLCEIYGCFDTQRIGSTVIYFERTLPTYYESAKCYKQTVDLISGDFIDRQEVPMTKSAFENVI